MNLLLVGTAHAQRSYEMPAALPTAAGCATGQCNNDLLPAERENVHLATGELHLSFEDLRIPGRGLDFVWKRTYRSKNPAGARMGVGWDHSYNLFIEADGDDLLVADGNGRKDRFVKQDDGAYLASGLLRVLTLGGEEAPTLQFPDLLRWNFHPLDGKATSGRVASIVDRNNNAILFGYDNEGRLTTVTDPIGRTVTIAYDSLGMLSALTDWTGRSVSYAYAAVGRQEPDPTSMDLVAATSPAIVGTPTGNDFPEGLTEYYTYDADQVDPALRHNLIAVTDPTGVDTFSYTYSTESSPASANFDRVVATARAGMAHAFDIQLDSPAFIAPPPGVLVITKDRLGNVVESYFDASNRLTTRRQFTGRANPAIPTTATTNRPVNKLRPSDPDFFETTWTYNVDSLVTLEVRPNGTRTRRVYERDLNPSSGALEAGNLREEWREPGAHLPVGDQATLVERMEYNSGLGGCCGGDFVSKHTDAMGNETHFSFDASGNRISKVADDGSTTNYYYDAHGRLVRTVHPVGPNGTRREDTRSYHIGGLFVGLLKDEVIDANGLAIKTTTEYDAWGNRVREVDPRGYDKIWTYNSHGKLVREQSEALVGPGGAAYRVSTDFTYNAARRLVTIRTDNLDENGVPQAQPYFTSTLGYHPSGFMTSVTAVLSGVPTLLQAAVYDAEGNEVLNRGGEAIAGNQPDNELAREYDERGLPFRVVRAPSSAHPSTEQYDYDGNGNRVRTTTGIESGGRITTEMYDAYDRRVQRTDPVGGVTTWNYDANGDEVHELFVGAPQGPSGAPGPVRLRESWTAYDTLRRRTQTVDAHFAADQTPIGDGARTTTLSFAPNSALLSTTFDDGGVESYEYDSAGRRVRTTLPSGDSRHLDYDAGGNVIAMVETDLDEVSGDEVDYSTLQFFDPRGLKVAAVEPGGINLSWGYDSARNLVLEVDGRGNVQRHAFDGIGRHVSTTRVLTSTGAGGGSTVGAITVQKTWDLSSRLVAWTDGEGNDLRVAYDALNRVIARRKADGALTQIGTGAAWSLASSTPDLTSFVTGFDAHDDILVATLENGSIVSASYDALGQTASRTITPGPGVSAQTSFENYTRDGLSRLTYASDDDSSTQFKYDSLDGLMFDSINGLVNQRLTDAQGREVALLNVLGRMVTKAYDTAGRLKSVDSSANLATFDYVGPYRISRRDNGNGTWTVDGYDAARRITSISSLRSVGGVDTVFDGQAFAWDAAGNKSSWISTVGGGKSRDLEYDSANRLVRVTDVPSGAVTSFTLDRTGNRTAVTGGVLPGVYTLDATLPQPADKQVNQYTTTPSGARTYANDGTTLSMSSAGRNLTLQYDYRGQLVSASDIANGYFEQYAYDALGRRLTRSITSGGSSTQHLYTYSGRRVVAEGKFVNGAVTELVEYAHGVMLDETICMWTNGAPVWIHTDDLYDVTCLTDASGSVVERYRYDVFGAPTIVDAAGATLAQSQFGNTRMLQSLSYDVGTGLYCNRARYYDPGAGRFLTDDPMGMYHDELALGNAKTRTANNPWSFMDASGFQTRRPSDMEPDAPWVELGMGVAGGIIGFFCPPLGISIIIHAGIIGAARLAGNKKWCEVEVTSSGDGGPAVGEKFCYVCPANGGGKCPDTVKLFEWDGKMMEVTFKGLNKLCTDDCGQYVLDIYPLPAIAQVTPVTGSGKSSGH